MKSPIHNPHCFASHLGLWLIDVEFIQQALTIIQSGIQTVWSDDGPHSPKTVLPFFGADMTNAGFARTGDGVAIVPINGPMMKAESKYGGTSTVGARRAIRAAVRDPEISSILLHVDSPGGHVAGTAELADEVTLAKVTLPVHAHIDDQGASAAYWVASQADVVSANRMAQVGSIGVFAVVADTSAALEAQGVKVHVISTGEQKGAMVPGTEITPEQLELAQEKVNEINQHFTSAVKESRSKLDLSAVSDGQTFIAKEARKLGLIDKIQSFEQSLDIVAAAGSKRNGRKKNNHHPKHHGAALSNREKAQTLLDLAENS